MSKNHSSGNDNFEMLLVGPQADEVFSAYLAERKFACVSHVWGDVTPFDMPEVKGVTWEVPISSKEKIDRILEVMKSVVATRNLDGFWMDVLCMDQSPANNKLGSHYSAASQVSHMRDCFTRTDVCVAFLDITDDHIDSLSQAIEKTRGNLLQWASEHSKHSMHVIDLPQLADGSADVDELIHRINDTEVLDVWGRGLTDFNSQLFDDDPRLGEAFRMFCSDAWWNRVWCYQELVLPSNLEFVSLSGSAEIKFVTGKGMSLLMFARENDSFSRWDTQFDDCYFIHKGLASHFFSKTAPLPFHIYVSGDRVCSRQHDNVYGVLGLTPFAATVRPDYELPMSKLGEVICDAVDEDSTIQMLFVNGPRLRIEGKRWMGDYVSCGVNPGDFYGKVPHSKISNGALRFPAEACQPLGSLESGTRLFLLRWSWWRASYQFILWKDMFIGNQMLPSLT
ncbi:hypothetical protein BJ742DRAFT_833288 [Cladochytrium replicatum]|nr:hypothetical protein BJ742DRAFT_833288 [Cladochytrium replicatum]